MNKEQSNDLESAEAGLKFLDKNTNDWLNLHAWENHHDKLEIAISEIRDTENTQSLDRTGDTRNKTQIRLDTGKKTNEVCGPLKTYLEDNNLSELLSTVDFSLSDLCYGNENTLIDRWKTVYDVASAHPDFITGGYDVTSAMITAINTGRSAFIAKAPVPKNDRAVKSVATEELKTEFKVLKKEVNALIQLAQGKLTSNVTFAKGLLKAFKVSDIGGRKVNAVFTFMDNETSVKLPKVEGTFTKANTIFTQKSTKKGFITVKGKAQGNWSLTAKLTGYQDVSIDNLAFDPEKPILRKTIKLVKN